MATLAPTDKAYQKVVTRIKRVKVLHRQSDDHLPPHHTVEGLFSQINPGANPTTFKFTATTPAL
jgi:hypothetical protein